MTRGEGGEREWHSSRGGGVGNSDKGGRGDLSLTPDISSYHGGGWRGLPPRISPILEFLKSNPALKITPSICPSR